MSDNTYSFSFEVTDSVYARDNGINDFGGVGIGGGLEGRMGNIFEITNPQFLTSISALIDNSTSDITGKNFEMEIYTTDGTGTPLILLATSESKTINGINQWYDLKLVPSLNLASGNYLMAIKQDTSFQQQIGASSSIASAGTCWVSWTNQTWTLAETFGFDVSLMIRANLNAVAGKEDNIPGLIKIYPNPTQDYIKITNLEIGSSVEIINSVGQKLVSFVTTTKDVSIDLTSFKSGFYTLKSTSNKEVRTSKFIKN